MNVSAVASGLRQYSLKMFGPRIWISPSSAMRTSTPGIGRPTVPIRQCSSVPTQPTAVVSVMP